MAGQRLSLSDRRGARNSASGQGISLFSQAAILANPVQEESEDSPELAHERVSNIQVPVTPDIHRETYKAPAQQASNEAEEPGYFTRDPLNHSNPAQPLDEAKGSSLSDLIRGAMSGEEVLRRMSQAAAGRRESISDIKSSAPDLALTGNIISATFTTPHTVKYHKNGEWVRPDLVVFHTHAVQPN